MKNCVYIWGGGGLRAGQGGLNTLLRHLLQECFSDSYKHSDLTYLCLKVILHEGDLPPLTAGAAAFLRNDSPQPSP